MEKSKKYKEKTVKYVPESLGEGVQPKMNSVRILAETEKLADQLCKDEGMELVLVEYQSEQVGKVLRVYIDKPGGVMLDDCANISRQLSDLIDVHIDTEESYSLEVSSPGVERPLTKPEDYERFKGCQAKLRTKQPIDGRRNFTGTLLGISDNKVKIALDKITREISYETITKAHLINDGER